MSTTPSVYARFPRKGRTARELAERTGMSTRSAQRWTSEPREVYLGRAAERRARVRELRAAGKSMRAIAKELGITVGAVHYAIHHDEVTSKQMPGDVELPLDEAQEAS